MSSSANQVSVSPTTATLIVTAPGSQDLEVHLIVPPNSVVYLGPSNAVTTANGLKAASRERRGGSEFVLRVNATNTLYGLAEGPNPVTVSYYATAITAAA